MIAKKTLVWAAAIIAVFAVLSFSGVVSSIYSDSSIIAESANVTIVNDTSSISNESALAFWLAFNDGSGESPDDWSHGATQSFSYCDPSEVAWTTAGKISNALAFSGACGSSDYVYSTLSGYLNVSPDFTVSAWVNTNQTTSDNNRAQIISAYDFSYMNYQLNIKFSGGSGYVEGRIIDENANTVTALGDSFIINDGAWHLLTFIRNTTADKLYVYVDGVEDANVADTTTASIAVQWDGIYIGSDGGYEDSDAYAGVIDDLGIWNRTLSSAEILGMHNNADGGITVNLNSYNATGLPSLNTSMVGWWNLDEGSGTGVTDYSGNGLTGTLSQSDHWTASGMFNSAYDFDGTDDKVTVLDNANLSFTSGGFSISAWVKRDNDNRADPILCKYAVGGYEYVFGFYTGNLLYGWVTD
ncbi:MAG: LamG domain-containing protein, partial [Candidatus Micrarchaeota archaeon]